MDMADNENFCKNCKRNVSAANFALHSAFCERNIFVCKICDEPVQISQKDQHLEEYHVISPCDLCKVPLEKWMLPKHMELCPKRTVVCKYCDADHTLDKHSDHVEFCGSRTEKCLLCQKYIMMKDKCKHNEFHAKNIEEEVKQNKVNEVISKRDLTAERFEKATESSINSISEVGDVNFFDIVESKIDREDKNLKSSRRNENLAHEGTASSRKQISKHFNECHICKKLIPWIDFNVHVPNCASSAGKCSVCGEDVSGNLIKEHMMKHTQGRSENQSFKVSKNYESYYETSSRSYQSDCAKNEIKCPYCSVAFSEDQILQHTKDCPRNVYECTLCNLTVLERHRTLHETSECRMTQENRVYDESYFSRSSQNCFECPLCSKQIPEKDRDKHTSFECEQFFQIGEANGLYAVGEDLYECPFCAEKMPQKDKQKHQSFYCKVLIENHSILSTDSYAEVTKKSCRKNCKCCQQFDICPNCKNKFLKEKISEHKSSCCRVKGPCEFCNEIIDFACKDIHLKFCSSLMKYANAVGEDLDECPYCAEKMPQKDIQKHQSFYCKVLIENHSPLSFKMKDDHNSRLSNYSHKEILKKTSLQDMMKPRSAKCTYCKTPYNVEILPNHEKECVHRPMKCSTCSREILLKDMNTHKCKRKKFKGKNQTLDQQASEENSEYSFWGKTKKFFSITDEKEEVKSEQPQYCSSIYSWERERNDEKLYFERNDDDTLLPCEFCQKEFPASQLVLHETGCQPDLVSYAKPNMPEISEPNESRSRQDYAKKDTTHASESESAHGYGLASHFFAKNNLISQKDTSDHIKCDRKSRDKAGEFLQLHYNAKSSSFENSIKENIDARGENEPLSYNSVWNASFTYFRDDHYLKQNVKNSNITKVEEATDLNKRKMDESEELNLPDDTPIQSDNEMTAVMKDESSESDEFVSLSDDSEEPGKSEMKLYLNSKDKKDKEDLTESKTAQDGKSKEDFPKTIECRDNAEKQQEHSKHFTDFRFGIYDTSLFSKNDEHYANQYKKTYDLQNPSKCFERSLNQKEQENSFRDQTKLKLGGYQLGAFSVDNCASGENNKEAEKLLIKHKATKFTESSNDQTGGKNITKHLSDFKLCIGESSALSAVENAYFPVKGVKNSHPERLHEQKVQKSNSKNEPKENLSYLKYSKNFSVEDLQENYKEIEKLNSEKNSDIIDTPVDNMDCTRSKNEPKENLSFLKYSKNFSVGDLQENYKKGIEKLNSEKKSDSIDTPVDNMDYTHNFKLYLPDFKFGVLKTNRKSSEVNVLNENLHESGHHQKQAFMFKPAECMKESQSSLYANVKKKEKVGLEEKIAALQRDKNKLVSVTDDENNDISKWKKYREKMPYDSSDCSD